MSSFVYSARRPFHPERLYQFMTSKEHTRSLLRSKGYCWIATRPQWVGLWSHAGRVMELSPQAIWWADVPRDEWPTDPAHRDSITEHFIDGVGDRRQELVFIGYKMEPSAVQAALDRVLLTDDEFAMGPEGWLTFNDPLPPWPENADQAEEMSADS
ncbi:MAG: GTP-binding protein [Zavarzinella sp.]